MDNYLHYKDSCIDDDFLLSAQARGADAADEDKMLYEMNNDSVNAPRILLPDNSRLISTSPPHENNLDLSNSLLNQDINFIEDNILQDPSEDDHPFNHVSTSFDLNEPDSSSNLDNGLCHVYNQRQLQDEFEEQMELSDQNIPDTSQPIVESLNVSVETIDDSLPLNNENPETIKEEPSNNNNINDDSMPPQIVQSESAKEEPFQGTVTSDDILSRATDCRIRYSPLPANILQKLKSSQKHEKKAKKREREEKVSRGKSKISGTSQKEEPSPPSALKLKKPRLQRLRACVTCNNDIYLTDSLIHERSIYCSIACIKGMVSRCRKCCKPTEKITFMDEVGTLIQLPNAQVITLINLEEFLMKEPYVKPFVDFAKLEETDTKPKFFDAEKGLKKEDAIRSAVKQNLHDQLMLRAKKSKVGVSRKATKELCDQIEIELYRIHKSVKAQKYKGWCADFLSQITNDSNMFFKNVVTNVYHAKKIVLLTKEEMYTETEETPKLNGLASSSLGVNSPKKERTLQKIKPLTRIPSKPAVSAVDMILGEEGADTTLKHNSHEFDSNCQICLRKVAERKAQMELIEKDREEEMEDRKRRKELGKFRKRDNKSPPSRPPRSSRWEAARRSAERSPIPSFDDDYGFDISHSPRRNSPPRRSRHDSLDFNHSQSFSTSIPGRSSDSPKNSAAGLIRTPPPGVSPDRLQIRTISPQPASFQVSRSPNSPPFQINDDAGFRGALSRRGGGPGPSTSNPYGQYPRSMGPPRPRFPEFGPRGAPRMSQRPYYEPEISWTPGMPRLPRLMDPPQPRFHRPISDYERVAEDSWRREEQWRPMERLPPEHDDFVRPEPYRHPVIPPMSPILRPSPPHHFDSPQRYQRSPEPPSPLPRAPVNPWKGKDRTLWNGKIEGESFNFRCSLQLISNPLGFKLAGKFPNPIIVKARVRPEPMWEFMKTIRTFSKFQTIIGVLGTDQSAAEVDNYFRCFMDLKKTFRCGVFDMPKELRIKEAYLFQLDPAEPLPPVLLPISGPGLPDSQRGMLCMVIIKYIDEPFILEIDNKQGNEVAKEEEEIPETLEDVLEAIETIDNPGELIKLVSAFIRNRNLTIEDKQKLQDRCRAKIERQKRTPLQAQPPPKPVEQISNERLEENSIQKEGNDMENTVASPIVKSFIPKKAESSNGDDAQLKIDESAEDEEEGGGEHSRDRILENPNSNNSGRESGEMRSEEDMDISDDERRTTSRSVLLPPPPPPPEMPHMIPSLFTALAPPPPPPPPPCEASTNNDIERDFTPAYPSSLVYIVDDDDVEDGELNRITPPLNSQHQQFPYRGRGGRNKKNRGGRGRGGGGFENAGPPQNMPLQQSPNGPRLRAALPPQEEMFQSIRGPSPRGGGANFRGARPPSQFPMRGPPRGGMPPRGPPQYQQQQQQSMMYPGYPPQYGNMQPPPLRGYPPSYGMRGPPDSYPPPRHMY